MRVDVRILAGCGLIALCLVPLAARAFADPHRPDPGIPTQGQIGAAAGQVNQRKAALGSASSALSAANKRLAALRAQEEGLVQRYDQALVDEQRAQSAYQVTQARLVAAQRAALASRRQVGSLAAEEYEAGGSFGSAAYMLGDPQGPASYLNKVGLGAVLSQNGTDTVAASKAADVVDRLFRAQAQDLLRAQQADVRAAAALKKAVQASVARQQDLVRAEKAKANTLSGQLAAAQAHEAALESARQAALAAAAQAQASSASRQATAAGGPPDQVQAPSWAEDSGASASQGDIAADWALSQLGKPYVWGAAGPATYDCSGLTMQAWAHAGVPLLHYTGYQWAEGPHVPLDQLQRGDLVFYATNTADPATIHHVGMYIGNGMMVDAPYTGSFVRIDPIDDPGLIGAVRPAP